MYIKLAALEIMFSTWVYHDRSLVIVTPNSLQLLTARMLQLSVEILRKDEMDFACDDILNLILLDTKDHILTMVLLCRS